MTLLRQCHRALLAGTAAALTLLAAAPGLGQARASVVTESADDEAEAQRSDYWGDSRRGWFFYEPKPKKRAKPPVNPPPALPAAPVAAASAPEAKPAKHPDLVRFEELQKRVEETRNIAIVNPTEENLRGYLEAQHLALETASRFAELSQRVVWTTPSLDPSVQGRPTAPTGASLYDAEQAQRKRAKWAQLAQTHAFFFFFRSDCPYCHRFAPLLKQFSLNSGIEVFPISMDGQGLPQFPEFRPDNGIAGRLNVTQVPALFLAEPRTGKVLPVGYGVISPNDLERRIDVITAPDAESGVPSAVKNVGDLARR
jgi:conjugal transfer pilus assembly protein TraF